MDLLDDVRVVEEAHFAQQSHLPDHEGGDPGLCRAPAAVHLLHPQEALRPPDLSGFVHLPEGALPDLRQDLIAQWGDQFVHSPPNSAPVDLNVTEKRRVLGIKALNKI